MKARILVGEAAPNVLSFFLTGNCNMACRYCFVNKEDLARNVLDEKSCYRAIDIFFDLPGEEKMIKFLGGEPLLAFGLLKKTALYAIKKNKFKHKKLNLVVETNGTLLDKHKLAFFEKNNFMICVSMDGNKRTHDINRRYHNSSLSTHDIISKNIAEISNKDRVIISYVITPQCLSEFIPSLTYLLGLGFHQVNFAYDIDNSFWTVADLKKLEAVFSNFQTWYIGLLHSGRDYLLIPRINSILKNSKGRQNACPNIKLGTDGAFYPCARIMALTSSAKARYACGSVKSGVDSARRIKFISECRQEIKKVTKNKCASCALSKYTCLCLVDFYLSCLHRKKNFLRYFEKSCSVKKIIYGSLQKISRILIEEKNGNFSRLYGQSLS